MQCNLRRYYPVQSQCVALLPSTRHFFCLWLHSNVHCCKTFTPTISEQHSQALFSLFFYYIKKLFSVSLVQTLQSGPILSTHTRT
uniref:Uncharacterized protein n=1 Tax=Nyssomyia neivai TaxID=330878 RepID=A0A1L8D7Y7_9DIPT